MAQGIHPQILTERGLAVAVEERAALTPVPVLVDLPSRRLGIAVESTAYFAISEALTNATKHADASLVVVRGRFDGDRLRIEVTDDGRGGADPGRGTGLCGLRDRVGALGGRLSIVSPAGAGHDARAGAAMRVIVAEDSGLYRGLLVRLLSAQGFDVVGEAAGAGRELLAVVDSAIPDLVLTDIRMPPTYTDEGCGRPGHPGRHPRIAVVVLTSTARPSTRPSWRGRSSGTARLPAQGAGHQRRGAARHDRAGGRR